VSLNARALRKSSDGENQKAANKEHAKCQYSRTICNRPHSFDPHGNLAGVLSLARVPIKLLLEVRLGIDGSTECAHRGFEFPATNCADCNDGGRTEPLGDSKVALFRCVVLLNHRTESLTCPGSHSS